MDTAVVVRDWVVAIIVIYVAVRYALLREQERASMRAELSRLKGQTASAVAEEYTKMREYAESISKEKQKLQDTVDELQEHVTKVQGGAKTELLTGVRAGLWEGASGILALVREIWTPARILGGTAPSVEVNTKFIKLSQELFQSGNDTIAEKMPNFPHIASIFRAAGKTRKM